MIGTSAERHSLKNRGQNKNDDDGRGLPAAEQDFSAISCCSGRTKLIVLYREKIRLLYVTNSHFFY
jgi:hypothetical protein